MEEDIKILEDYIKLINKGYCNECNELCNIYGAPSYPSRAISQAIGNLLKAYKELKEENRELKNTQKILEHNYQIAIAETINKYVVKEKIEEIKIRLNDDCIALHEFQRLAKIDVLKELLGEE